MDKLTFITEIEKNTCELMKSIYNVYRDIGIALQEDDSILLYEAIDYLKEFEIKYALLYDDITFTMTAFSLLAKDFRRCIGSITILQNLRNIARKIKSVCRFSPKKTTSLNNYKLIYPLLKEIIKKLKTMYKVYQNNDIKKAFDASKIDDEIDEIYDTQFLKTINKLRKISDNKEAKELINVCIVLDELERIGDVIVFIYEEIVYIKKAKHYDLTND